MRRLLSISAVLCIMALPAWADWILGDPYKMHYPQLPDPTGWDILAVEPQILADDFQCSETGPITDTHFWGSWEGDSVGLIVSARLRLYSNLPADDTVPYSRPGDVLWSWDVQPTLIASEPDSPQGWFTPVTGESQRPDHERWFQYNIVDIPNPFVQQQGQVYWLGIQVDAVGGTWGWKSSASPQFGDDAVWAQTPQLSWQPVKDPVTGQSLDLAFVITPEPASILLLIAGGLCLQGRTRR